MKECYYVPKELLHLVQDRFPDAIGLDFRRPIEDQLYNFADQIKNSVPKTILDETLPKEEVKRLTEMVLKAHRRLQVTLATRESSWPMWFKNTLHNYNAIINHGIPVDEVIWPHAEKPVVIVGSGPSVHQIIPQIMENRDKYCVIATWHSLYRLLEHHIQPDAVIHIDKMEPVHAPPVDLPKHIPVIISPVAHEAFLSRFSGHPVYYLLTRESEPHQQWAEFLGREPHKPAFGTVIYFAIRAALYFGHTQVILTGVDLCFPDKGGFVEHSIKKEAPLEVLNAEGKTCYAPQSFLMYRDALQTLAQEEKDAATFYNASPGGLELQGYAHWTWT